MAASATHVVLTDKIYQQHFSDKNKRDFFLGTVLPDIRYLGKIDRDITHFTNLNLEDIKREESFLAGLHFHSLLDLTRDKFITESGLYDWYPDMKNLTRSIKLLEDEMLYAHVREWSVYLDYLEQIIPAEILGGLSEATVQKWHQILHNYWRQPPCADTHAGFMSAIGFASSTIAEDNKEVEILRKDKRVLDLVESLYRHFDELIIHGV